MIEVVAALIIDNNKFMICQRPAFKARPLLWEFPGGKLEKGETEEEALVRECREELDVTLEVSSLYTDVSFNYPDIDIHLSLYKSRIKEGTPKLLEHSNLKWITPSELGLYDFCPADCIIIKKLKKEKAL